MFSPSVSSFPFVFDSFTVLYFYSNIMIISMAPLHTFGGFVESSHVVVFCSFLKEDKEVKRSCRKDKRQYFEKLASKAEEAAKTT